MFVIISFDILECPDRSSMGRRIYKLNKILKGYGQRAQKSVFEAYLDNPQIESMKKQIASVIEPIFGDNVRIYKLCNTCFEKIEVVGTMGIRPEEDAFIF